MIYQWKTSDKLKYAISMIPYLAGIIGSIYVLWNISYYLVLIFLGLFLLANIFQAGACTGCPYRGKYCPPIFGVYLGNILSNVLYRNRILDMKQIKKNASAGEVTVYLYLAFPFYFLFTLMWYYPLIYLGLMITHLVFFMPTQCEKCSYNDVCPGGISWTKCKSLQN